MQLALSPFQEAVMVTEAVLSPVYRLVTVPWLLTAAAAGLLLLQVTEAPSTAGSRAAFSTALWPEARDRLLWSRVRVLEGGVTGSVGTSVMGV